MANRKMRPKMCFAVKCWSESPMTRINADGAYEGNYSLQGALIHSVNTVSAALIMERRRLRREARRIKREREAL